MFIATLIAAQALGEGDISAARDALAEAGCEPGGWSWLEPAKAGDLRFSGDLAPARQALDGMIGGVDVIAQPEVGRAKKLFVADMDSTIITVECLDELADYAGIKPKVAEITERAMRGKIDFAEALAERVQLLKGLNADLVTRCHEDRVALTPGAAPLVRTMRSKGARCVLVSGGFTLFADRVAHEAGFDRTVANVLDIAANELAGTVAEPIVDSAAKLATLREEQAALRLEAAEILAVGDGVNDLPMIEAAGLGVAFHGKPRLREAADARIDHGDLTALLYAQGYRKEDWVEV